MPVVPYDSNDTVIYNGTDLYVPKDCSVTVFEDSRVFLFGEWYLNGQPILTGQGVVSGQEVAVGPTQPGAGITLWFDTSAGYGELKVLVGGSWKTVEDPADAVAADEVSIGVGQPIAPNYEMWVDTSVTPENLKAKVGGSWKSINSEVVIGGTEPVDPAVELWVDTATPAPAPSQSYVNPGNAIGIIAQGVLLPNVTLPANTNTQVTNTLSVTLLAGRRYKVHINIRAASINSGGTASNAAVYLRDGTTIIPDLSSPLSYLPPSNLLFGTITYSWILDGDGLNKNLNVAINPQAIASTAYTSNQGYFHVEDVGPTQITAIPVVPPPNTYVSPGNALGIVGVGTLVFGNPLTLPANTATQVTSNITVTFSSGRRYRVVFRARAISTNTAGTIQVSIVLRDGTAGFFSAAALSWVPANNTGFNTIVYDWIFDGDNTTKSLNVTLNPATQASSLYSNEQGYFYVEDIGPNQYPALPVPATAPAWTPISSFSGTWLAFGSSFQVPGYRMIGDRVELRGLLKNATSLTANTTYPIATLPVGFRPSLDEMFTGAAQVSGNQQPGRIDVTSAGVLNYTPPVTGAVVFASLDQIVFSVTP